MRMRSQSAPPLRICNTLPVIQPSAKLHQQTARCNLDCAPIQRCGEHKDGKCFSKESFAVGTEHNSVKVYVGLVDLIMPVDVCGPPLLFFLLVNGAETGILDFNA